MARSKGRRSVIGARRLKTSDAVYPSDRGKRKPPRRDAGALKPSFETPRLRAAPQDEVLFGYWLRRGLMVRRRVSAVSNHGYGPPLPATCRHPPTSALIT